MNLNLIIQRVCEMFDQATFKACASCAFGIVGWLLGGFDLPFKALALLYGADFLLGFIRAGKGKCISLTKIRGGAYKFLLYGLAVMVAHWLDMAVDGFIPWLDNPVRDFMICYLSVCEFLSVSVHLAALGIRMPAWILIRVTRFRDLAEKGECSEVSND